MRGMKIKHWLWLIPLLATASDALAWGLYTHVYFAQALLWLVPVADPAMRAAARRFPRLVMAGACLPDLALMGGWAKTAAFECSHEWETAARLLRQAQSGSDEERALALGFASHLFTDIFAHNHFVPAHEIVWGDVPVLTHASCEWALDHHLAPELFARPAELMRSETASIIPWVVSSFGCTTGEAEKALQALAGAEALLRWSVLPRVSHGIGRRIDRRMVRRFRHYLSNTVRRLGQMDRLIAGEAPQWEANPARHKAQQALANVTLRSLKSRLPIPRDVFATAR